MKLKSYLLMIPEQQHTARKTLAATRKITMQALVLKLIENECAGMGTFKPNSIMAKGAWHGK